MYTLKKLILVLAVPVLLISCRLGGEVSGSFDELVLREEITGSSLSVVSPGYFEFADEFDNGTNYQVTIDQDASVAASHCVVSQGEGVFEWKDVTNVRINCSSDICTLDYTPVCGKKDNNIVCITTPCPTRTYKTYSNLCALNSDASNHVEFAIEGECGLIEGLDTFAAKPVQLFDDVENVPTSLSFELVSSSIDGDILNLELRYGGGCGDHDLSLYVNSLFMESFPVQVDVILVHDSKDRCKAIITGQHSIDLAGLREHYNRNYQSGAGSIVLGELGTFTF